MLHVTTKADVIGYVKLPRTGGPMDGIVALAAVAIAAFAVAVVAGLAAFDLATLRWGANTRDRIGGNWQRHHES
jgi:hypothetical protein